MTAIGGSHLPQRQSVPSPRMMSQMSLNRSRTMTRARLWMTLAPRMPVMILPREAHPAGLCGKSIIRRVTINFAVVPPLFLLILPTVG